MVGTVLVRDITAQRAAAQALRQSEERQRLILENVRDYAIFCSRTAAPRTTACTCARTAALHAAGILMLMRDDAGAAVGFVKILRDLAQPAGRKPSTDK